MQLPTSWVQLILLFSILQGLILSIALSNVKYRKASANKILISFILSLSFLLFTLLFAENSIVKKLKLGYIADGMGLLYGPLLYFYTKKLLMIERNKPVWIHLIPSFVFIAFNLSASIFLNPKQMELPFINIIFSVLGITGIIQISAYLFLSLKTINSYQKSIPNELSYIPQINYLKSIIWIVIICILMFFTDTLSELVGFRSLFRFIDYGLAWLLISLTTFFFAYYAITQPEIFKLNITPTNGNKKNISELPQSFDLEKITASLLELMEEQKLFLNPDLSLDIISKKLEIRKELISKAINSGFSMNFYRFVNQYRIKEFKTIALDERNNHLSQIGLAYEAGFKSKTTFYKAFKELTNATPSEYLRGKKA